MTRTGPAVRRYLLRAGAVAAAAVVATALAAGSTSSLLTASARASATGEWSHDPASPLGPGLWAGIGFPLCGSGVRQSPIDVATGTAIMRGGPALVLESRDSELAVENTGRRGGADPAGRQRRAANRR